MRRTVEQFIGLLQVTRPLTCLGTSLLTLAGAYLVSEAGGAAPLAQRATVMVGLIAAACNALNDYHDVRTDRLNKPQRPIPAGRITRRAALGWAGLLALASAILAWSLGLALSGVALGLALLGVSYSYYFKNTVLIGNAVVGLLCGSTVAYGAWAQSGLSLTAALAGVGVALFVFSREILGTVLDQSGDVLTGVTTIATRWGRRAALRFFHLAAVAFIFLSLTPWLLHLAPARYLYAVVPVGALPIAAIAVALSLRSTEPVIRAARSVMKLQWFAGLVAITFLK